ncbi:MAG: hypothetical protein L3J41_03535 [Melioribacteraceae bacterium]|nr:hypothetical protein [Melioribacteraceae bacterium]
MNGGQQLMVLGALVMLSYLVLSIGNTSNVQLEAALLNESIISGSALAQSLMEEIQSRAFDENTISQAIASSDELTSSNSFGPDGEEVAPSDFNDIDDYDGYSVTYSLSRMGEFSAEVDVYYIAEFEPETPSLERTFSKRIDITISNAAIDANIVFTSIVSY